jgi:hypothetical protein
MNSILRLLMVLTGFLASSRGYNDLDETCQPGHKISGISRDPPLSGDKVGKMNVQCEALDPAPSNPVCEETDKLLVCNGKEEPCEGDSWLGGLKAYEMDTTSGAMLFHPICCVADDFKLGKCRKKTLNKMKKGFSHTLSNKQVYASMKCWRMYGTDRVVIDFLWQPKVCKYTVGGGGRRTPKARRTTRAPRRGHSEESEEEPEETMELGAPRRSKKPTGSWESDEKDMELHMPIRGKDLPLQGSMDVDSLDECKGYCEEINERVHSRKATKCGSLMYYKKGRGKLSKKNCEIFSVKPINLCESWKKEKKGVVLAVMKSVFKGNKYSCH